MANVLVYKGPHTGGLNNRNFSVSQFWRLEARDEGIGRLVPPKAEGESAPCLSPVAGVVLAISEVPWLVGASPWSPSSSSRGPLRVWVSVPELPRFRRTLVITAVGDRPAVLCLILTSNSSKDPISQ